jgi:5-dehydro-2-deoxygluconokinase
VSTEETLQLLTVGRVGVDLYPHQNGPLKDVTSFGKFLGGTATNVAVGAARLGHRAAVLTKVGPDGFGDYVREALAGFGVDASHVGTADGLMTPVVFCELNPAEDPPLLFYRQPVAPDLTLEDADVPWDLVRDVPVLWVTGTGVSVEPARTTQLRMLERRGRLAAGTGRHTVLDLDWRPMFWPSPEHARREYQLMLEHVTAVVGNRGEVEVAVGTADPHEAAKLLLERGVELVIVKMGGDGVLVATPDGSTVVPPHRVEVVCGLGAGDAFGGALVHGLLSDLEPVRIAQLANAAGAIVAARLACADAMPTLAELEDLVATPGSSEMTTRTSEDRRFGPTLSDEQWSRLLQLRVNEPEAVMRAYAERRRPAGLLSERGTLFLVAADHPARGALGTGGDAMAMADRRSLLARLLEALEHPDVDGVLGTPDVVEELLLLGALDGKVVIGSMNRGGLDGASWTMDDRFTGYDAASIDASRLEGGKMLLRIDDQDAGTAETIERCAQAVSELAERGLMAMVEPLPYHREDSGDLTLRKDAHSLARAVTIASGLGTTSAHTWLKMPSCEEPETVFGATTLPCVVLGGVPSPDPGKDLKSWGRSLAQPSVRGLVVGRALLYPPDNDVKAAVEAAAQVLRVAHDSVAP